MNKIATGPVGKIAIPNIINKTDTKHWFGMVYKQRSLRVLDNFPNIQHEYDTLDRIFNNTYELQRAQSIYDHHKTMYDIYSPNLMEYSMDTTDDKDVSEDIFFMREHRSKMEFSNHTLQDIIKAHDDNIFQFNALAPCVTDLMSTCIRRCSFQYFNI